MLDVRLNGNASRSSGCVRRRRFRGVEAGYLPRMSDLQERGRVELLGVGDGPGAGVRLRRGNDTAQADVAAGGDRVAAVATATLDALAELLPPVVAFTVGDIHLIAGDRPIVVVNVNVEVGALPIPHVGCSFVRDDPGVAAAKATLCAVNRRLEILGI